MERARTEWLRALGVEQTALARDHGAVFVVSSLAIDYLRPAAFNDELTVTVELETLGAVQIMLKQRIARGAEALAAASVRIAKEPITRPRSGPLEYPAACRNACIDRLLKARPREESEWILGN